MSTLTAFAEIDALERDLCTAMRAVEREADNGNVHAVALLRALDWILAQPKSLAEKLDAMHRLVSLPPGDVLIPSLAEFLGWAPGTVQ